MMDPKPAAASSFIKSERVDGASTSKNELSRSCGKTKDANDLNEVSPSATDEASTNPGTVVKCTFCSKTPLHFDDARLLECLHTACLECINARSNSDTERVSIMCNICHIASSRLIENPFLTDASLPCTDTQSADNPRLANAKCTSCHDNLVATSWCVDCNDFLCDGCVQAHQRLKITKDHTIKSKEEADMENNSHGNLDVKLRTESCSQHPQERLTLYCEACDKLTCRDCQLNYHKLHRYKFIDELATETKTTINNLLSEVNYKRVLLKSAMKVIDDRQQLIVDKKKDLLNEITQMVVKLTDAVTSRGKNLVSILNEICDSKQRTLNEKKVALEQLSLLTDHCIEFITNALERGNDLAVLKTKSIMLHHLQNVKSKRADIPNPEIPVRIQLALDKANEVCQMVSKLGILIVDGRQYNMPAGFRANSVPAPSPNQNQLSVVNPYTANSLPHHSGNNAPLILSSPVYGVNNSNATRNANNNCNNSCNNSVPNNNNMSRTPPAQISFHQRAPNARPQHMTNLNPHFNVTNNQMKNVHLPSYQQHVTSSTHPQNSLYHSMNSQHPNYDQSLRKLLMNCDKQNANVVNVNSLPYRSTTPQQPVVYQNADTMSNNRIQSVSPQSNVPNIRYPPTMVKMYQQQQYQANCSNLMQPMQGQPGRTNMVSPSARQIMSRESSLSPLPQQHLWHTPQINHQNTGNRSMTYNSNPICHMASDDSFKITLPAARSKPAVTPPTAGVSVSSSVSKTPSPHNQTKSLPEETEKNLDKVRQDGVNELMATIAKLDSNGVNVIPETSRKPGDSPLVDSSTGPPIDQLLLNERTASNTSNPAPGSDVLTRISNSVPVPEADRQSSFVAVAPEPQKGCDDPNEDWCAVCMDGGHLVCCDNCPKVFHVPCHIPPLPELPGPNDSWQCLLCTNILDYAATVANGTDEKPPGGGLSPQERKIMERILLELYCQYDQSLPFREAVNPDMVDYYEKIKQPMSLDIICKKLLETSENPYMTVVDFVRDIRLVFNNAYLYNEEGSPIHSNAKALEEFFDQLLEKWLPAYVVPAFDDAVEEGEEEEEEEEEDDLGEPARKRRKSSVND